MLDDRNIQHPASSIMSQSISSTDRLLTLRLRPDLLVTPVTTSGSATWVVKDPMTLEHFQFSAEEYALLDWLRQPVSIGELCRRFAERFPPQSISPQAIWDFLGRLHGAGLLIGDGPGQGQELLARMRREQARRWAGSWTGILAIRFRGLDPDSFLTAVHTRLRWLFSPVALLVVLAVVVYAASLVVGHFDEFLARLPEVNALFDSRNLLWLLLSIGVVKVLHELGHALACKHFGGEVHELGLMLLVFTPCLYCDVTDSWRLANKWHRIVIAAGGMFVEVVLAAVATVVWWHAQPGAIQLLAMNVMIVCTVGTLIVNGNPLLRYDGYYILSDLVETPNLWQRSRDVLRRFASEWLLGEPATHDLLVPVHHRAWLAIYAALSKTYVALVCIVIVWGLVQVLYPLHLQNLAYAVGLAVLGSAMTKPISSAAQFARNPIRRADVQSGRLALIVAVCIAAAVAVLAVPVTYHVRAPLVLMPDDAARVYATIDGTLVEILRAGQPVRRGDAIGALRNVEVQLDLTRADGEFAQRKLRVEHLERLRGVDPEANDELPTARAALADSERRLVERRRDVERLTLRAPEDGIIMLAPRLPDTRSKIGRVEHPIPDIHLARWSGSPLEPTNLGAFLEPGTLVCLVGNPNRLTAVLLVDDTDVKRLQPGQSVQMRIDQLPGQVVSGEVADVARHEVLDDDNKTAGQADLATLYAGLVPPGGRYTAHYQVRVRFDSPQQPLVIGGRGEAKVAAERITLARSILRFLGQTFRLPM
jgi:putative peptide zinc metalloprotease protein